MDNPVKPAGLYTGKQFSHSQTGKGNFSPGFPFLPAGPQAAENMLLEFDVKIRKLPEQAYTPPSPPSGPALPEPGKMTYEDITIINNPFEASLPEWKPPAEPEKITDMSVLVLNFGGRVERIESLKDTEETQKIRIPMSEYSGNLTALNIRNRNTHREITVSGIRIYNPEERGEYVPLNPAPKRLTLSWMSKG